MKNDGRYGYGSGFIRKVFQSSLVTYLDKVRVSPCSSSNNAIHVGFQLGAFGFFRWCNIPLRQSSLSLLILKEEKADLKSKRQFINVHCLPQTNTIRPSYHCAGSIFIFSKNEAIDFEEEGNIYPTNMMFALLDFDDIWLLIQQASISSFLFRRNCDLLIGKKNRTEPDKNTDFRCLRFFNAFPGSTGRFACCEADQSI